MTIDEMLDLGVKILVNEFGLSLDEAPKWRQRMLEELNKK